MVGKEVACASPLSFIAAGSPPRTHSRAHIPQCVAHRANGRMDGRTVSPVCLPTAALHRHPSTSDKSRNRQRHSLELFRPGSNHVGGR